MSEVSFFWTGWEPIGRIVVVGTLAYASIVLILRISGKRTLASMNAFDFIITVALGAAFGRTLTAKQVSIAEAASAFLLLTLLQFLVSWLEVRSKTFSNLVTAHPTLLFYKGELREKVMRQQRIRKNDILASVRKNNLSSLDEVEAIVLEADGALAVVKKGDHDGRSALDSFMT